MIDPKVVFEAVPSRWRVEYRPPWTDEWRTHRYHHTLEEACEAAQEMTNNDLDGAYRVVDTRPDKAQPVYTVEARTIDPAVGTSSACAYLSDEDAPLTMDTYQQQAKATAVYPEVKADQYLIAGLAGEVGELASIFAKHWRGDGDLNHDHAKAELGDVLWFVAMLAEQLDTDLFTVAQGNLNKLADRAERGKLKGSGDNR